MRCVLLLGLIAACAHATNAGVERTVTDARDDAFPLVLGAAKQEVHVADIDVERATFVTSPVPLDDALTTLTFLVHVRNSGVRRGRYAGFSATRHAIVVTPIVFRGGRMLTPDELPSIARDRAHAFAEQLLASIL
jgi:hypothetical protein